MESNSINPTTVIREPASIIWDFLFPVLCIIIGFFGLRLVFNTNLWGLFISTDKHAVSVGNVFRNSGKVRYRSGRSIVWHDIAKTTPKPVANGDTIFTGNDGNARLEFVDGGSAQIQTNSLVVVSDVMANSTRQSRLASLFKNNQAQPKIQILKGNVNLALKKSATPIEITVKNKTYKVSSVNQDSKVSVSVKGANENSVVEFSAGSTSEINIQEKGKEKNIQITDGETASTENQGNWTKNKTFYELVSPQDKKIVISPKKYGDSVEVPIRWHNIQALPKGFQTKIELEGAEDKALRILPKATSTVLRLKEGDYKWRLVSYDSKGRSSQTSWNEFEVNALTAPILDGPVDNTNIVLKNSSSELVSFSWEELPHNLQALVEIRSAKQKNKKGHIHTGSKSGLSVAMNQGKYFWRARSINSAKQGSSWSEWRRLKVGVIEKDKLRKSNLFEEKNYTAEAKKHSISPPKPKRMPAARNNPKPKSKFIPKKYKRKRNIEYDYIFSP